MKTQKLRTVTLINGRLVQPSEAKISVFDNSLLYAEGLFETFLAIDDRIIFPDEHLDRLYKGSSIIGLELPFPRERLLRWMTRAVKAHPDRIKKLRLTITSGQAARWVGIQGKPQIIISASPHTIQEQPFVLHVSEFRVDQHSIFRQVKTISYAIHAAALKKAREIGADDALLLNERNRIAEVTSANIFWVRRGKIFTPPLKAGCLEGVTRQILLHETKKLGLSCVETDDTLANMLRADEVFITSSLKLVAAVVKICDNNKSYRLECGPVTRKLREHFFNLVGLCDE